MFVYSLSTLLSALSSISSFCKEKGWNKNIYNEFESLRNVNIPSKEYNTNIQIWNTIFKKISVAEITEY